MHERNARICSRAAVWPALAVFAVFLVGTALRSYPGDPAQNASGKPARTVDLDNINIKFSNRWTSVAEIERLAENHIRQRDGSFSIQDKHVSVWIESQGTGTVAAVVFTTSLAGQAWKVKFSPSGSVSGYSAGSLGEGPYR